LKEPLFPRGGIRALEMDGLAGHLKNLKYEQVFR
jgi:hypothetical protein